MTKISVEKFSQLQLYHVKIQVSLNFKLSKTTQYIMVAHGHVCLAHKLRFV